MTFWKKIPWKKINEWFIGELSPEEIYRNRKDTFVENLDARQKLYHSQNRGASWTEVVLELEDRINRLEIAYRKIPVLTEVVAKSEMTVAKPKAPRIRIKHPILPREETEIVQPAKPVVKDLSSMIAPITLSIPKPMTESIPKPIAPVRIRKPRTPK